jgi:hypothetical protein
MVIMISFALLLLLQGLCLESASQQNLLFDFSTDRWWLNGEANSDLPVIAATPGCLLLLGLSATAFLPLCHCIVTSQRVLLHRTHVLWCIAL